MEYILGKTIMQWAEVYKDYKRENYAFPQDIFEAKRWDDDRRANYEACGLLAPETVAAMGCVISHIEDLERGDFA